MPKKSKETPFIPCMECTQVFQSFDAREKHISDTLHFEFPSEMTTKKRALRVYLDSFFDSKVMIAKQDRRESRITVQHILGNLMQDVTKQPGGEVYSEKPIPAGSTSTQTKVGKADEFDYNVEMKIPLETIRREGYICFDFENDLGVDSRWHPSGRTALATPRNVVRSSDPTVIPIGYCVATVPVNHQIDALNDLTHDTTYGKYVIPRYVQEDLYEKLNKVIQSKEMCVRENPKSEPYCSTVRLQAFPNGPAVTMLVKRIDKHEIGIDFAVSIDLKDHPCITVGTHGWPRKETKKVLEKDEIEEILAAGVHLIPKKDMFWYISYSHPAKVLLNKIDTGSECSRKCHKIMKRDFQIWKSKSDRGFSGISTYIFKHHLFWMNEKRGRDKEYWKDENIGQCYIDMLKNFAKVLKERSLANYFNPKENILQGKDPSILDDLARFMIKRKEELLNIEVDEFVKLKDDIKK